MIGEALICNMKNQIDNETTYFNYFEQLIEFEKSIKDKESRSRNIFVVVPYPASQNIKNGIIKKACLTQRQ